jgi:hypothetical protein
MLRSSAFAALLALLALFGSCERHHVGEFPELQREHLNPFESAAEETRSGQPTPPVSPTPANFFPRSNP